jgi:glutaredoxin 3
MLSFKFKESREKPMDNVIIYTSAICPYCVRAKQLLQAKGLTYTEIRVDLDEQKREEMVAKTGRQTVPQIFINNQHIGGCDDLYAYFNEG